MRLIWFAHETDRDVDGAIDLLLDIYLRWREDGNTLETMQTILALAQELQVVEVDVETLHGYLADRQALAQHNCTFAEVPEALRMIEILSQLPTSWDWTLAEAAMQGVAVLMQEGVTPEEVGEFTARHRRFKELGFDEAMAEALADVLAQAGAVGERRDAILQSMIEVAREPVDREELAQACANLHEELAGLEARRAGLRQGIDALRVRRDALTQKVEAAHTRLAAIEAESAAKVGDLDVLRALRAFLLRNSRDADAFFEDLLRLDRWRKRGGAPDDVIGARYSKDLLTKLVTFIQQIAQELQAASKNG